MSTFLIINGIGLLISIIGTLVMYLNSPQNFHTIDGGDIKDDNSKNSERTDRKNECLKIGFLILLIGNLIQLLSVLCEICSNQS